VSQKHDKITAIIDEFRGQDMDPHYLGFIACFNRQQYFEAHEVLERIWLPQRQGANGSYYKGLIQLAGAFVHLQKNRLGPAFALFKLAESNLEKYPAAHERLDLARTLGMIAHWQRQLGSSGINPFSPVTAPILRLELSPERRN
jgi:predicted metal-dependent hydrolase